MGVRFSGFETREQEGCNRATPSSSSLCSGKPSPIVKLQSINQWKTLVEGNKKNNKLMVVDFTASWCSFCNLIAPTFDEYAQTYKNVDFIQVDMTSPQNDFMDLCRQYEVRGYPTFVLIKDGKEVDKVVGANKEDLKKKIEKHRTG